MKQNTEIRFYDDNGERKMSVKGNGQDILNAYATITAAIFNVIAEEFGEEEAADVIREYQEFAIAIANLLDMEEPEEEK